MACVPAKTQISLGIHPLRKKKAWVLIYRLSAQWRPRLIWVFAGAHTICFGFVMRRLDFAVIISNETSQLMWIRYICEQRKLRQEPNRTMLRSLFSPVGSNLCYPFTARGLFCLRVGRVNVQVSGCRVYFRINLTENLEFIIKQIVAKCRTWTSGTNICKGPFRGHQALNELPHRKTNKNDMCAQRRLRSAWASAQSDQSLHCLHEETLGP